MKMVQFPSDFLFWNMRKVANYISVENSQMCDKARGVQTFLHLRIAIKLLFLLSLKRFGGKGIEKDL